MSRPVERSERRGGALTRFLFVVAVVGGLGYGALALRRHALESERFGLVEIEVRGAKRVDPRLVRERAGLPAGQNVFAVELDRVETAVEKLGWVKTAQAERMLPDRVRITIEEHAPAALVALGDLYYVDVAGRVFRAYVPGEPVDLPVVLGVDREGFERDDGEAIERLRSALRFLDAYREVHGASAGAPREVEVAAAGLVRFTTPSGVSVWAGRAPWQGVLRRIDAVLGPLGEETEIEELFAGRGRRSDRAVLRYRETGRAPSTERPRRSNREGR